MKKNLTLLLVCICTISFAKTYKLTSPNNKIVVSIDLTKKINYSVKLNNKTVLDKSEISLKLKNGVTLGKNFGDVDVDIDEKSDIIKPVVRQKFAEIKDHYKLMTLDFEDKDFKIEFRAYNDGVAYRFVTEIDEEIVVESEQVEFKFPKNFLLHFPEEESIYSHQERRYIEYNIDNLKDGQFCSTPMLVDAQDGHKILITEANLYDYAGMFLEKKGSRTLKGKFANYPKTTKKTSDRDVRVTEYENYLAKTKGNRTFPWRVMVITEKDADLITSEMVFKLADPLKIKADWVKPGKVAWDWFNFLNISGVDFRAGENTATYKYFIDFAAKYGIEYVILDEGWYDLKDVMKVKPAVDMEELARYSKEKNVGLILWVTWKAFEDKLDEALVQFSKWGVKGVKVDFMQRDDQWMVNYYERIAQKCAKYEMLVDFHGSYKPTGLRRAYPNVITREGVHGNEQNKWTTTNNPDHCLMLPFTRMVAGPLDYTPGAMRNAVGKSFKPVWHKPMGNGTRAHELAKYVVFESPLQMLCDNPTHYYQNPQAMKFLADVPAVWDNTIVNDAEYGKHVSIARKSGNKWYLGVMTNSKKREISFPLNFLGAGTHKITIWQDGINADRNAEDCKMIEKTVTNKDVLKIKMAPGGGFVAVIN
jgi:alpha-glucosidase